MNREPSEGGKKSLFLTSSPASGSPARKSRLRRGAWPPWLRASPRGEAVRGESTPSFLGGNLSTDGRSLAHRLTLSTAAVRALGNGSQVAGADCECLEPTNSKTVTKGIVKAQHHQNSPVHSPVPALRASPPPPC